MQKYFFTLLFLVFSTITLLAQQSEIVVKGTVEYPYENYKIKISHIVDNAWSVVDSITVNADKTFEKTITLPMPGVYEIDCQQWERLNFWGENENIEINFRGADKIALEELVAPYRHVENAGENNELLNLARYSDYRTSKARATVREDLNIEGEGDSEDWERIAAANRSAFRAGAANIDYLAKTYLDRNSVVALLPRIRNANVKEEVIAYLEQHKSEYSPYVKYKQEIAEKEAEKQKIAPGVLSPDFAYLYRDGKQGQNLKDFRGKYLLIDFWASWCGPCRKSIPALKELYEEYGAKDFEILSVSIDGEKKYWFEALDEENMPWPQIFVEDTGKEVMDKFLFSAIPLFVLIDKEGKIMQHNISLSDLKKMLSEVL